MSKLAALLTLSLLATAACVSEEPAALDTEEAAIDLDEVMPAQPGAVGTGDRLPAEGHPGALSPVTPAPIASVFPEPTACVLVTAGQARAIVDATRRTLQLVDRDLAQGEPGSLEDAQRARASLADALAHAEVALAAIDGSLRIDDDPATTSDAEAAIVRAETQQAIAGLSVAIDLSVERAYARHKLDRQAGFEARQAAVLAGKIVGVANELRARAIECELGVWRQ